MSNYSFARVLLGIACFAIPSIASALNADGVFDLFIALVIRLIQLMIGFAILAFFWGLVKFIAHAGDEKALDEGKQLMIWGMIGLFVMVALWSIVGFLQISLGLNSTTPLGNFVGQPNTVPVPPAAP